MSAKMKPFLLMLVGAGAGLVLGACAGQRPAVNTAPDQARPYEFESEGQVAPEDESATRREIDHVDVFQESPVQERTMPVQDVEPADEVLGESADSTMMTTPGYRVQVFASGTEETARRFERTVELALGETAHVELINGIYKVQVGDCRFRSEAEELLERCRRAGYGDAWIVAGPIVIPRSAP